MQVSFGNLSVIGGKSVLSGAGGSGIDTESLVKSLVEAREIPKTKLTDKQTANTDKLSALGDFRTSLTTFQSTTNFLRNPPSFGVSITNAFDYRTAFVTASDGSASTNYVTIQAETGAEIGSYDITVDNLAVAKSNTSISFSSKTAGIATLTGAGGTPKAGTFTLNGESVTIEVGDSLEDIVSKINSTSSNSDTRASIIQVGDAEFKLRLSATNTGTANSYTTGGDATVFNSMFTGVGASSQAAENAQITINGSITVTRSENSFADAIDGVTINIFQETGAATLRVDIDNDIESVATAITNFVDEFNNLKVFAAKQQERDEEGNYVETAILGQNQLLSNTLSRLTSELANVFGGIIIPGASGTNDYGISLSDFEGDAETPAIRNILQVDNAKLVAALESNFDELREKFEFQMNSSLGGNLLVFERTNQFSIEEFDLDIDYTVVPDTVTGTTQAEVTYVDDNGATQTIYADITFSTPETAASKDVTEGILGAATATDLFSSLSDGDNFRITLVDIDGTTTDFDFTYQTVISDPNTEFNTLTNLATAISNQTDLVATISNNKLLVRPADSDGLQRMQFSNLGLADIVGELELTDTAVPTATITGQEGTVLEGLSFIYAGDGTDTTTVTLSQGVGDRIYNVLEDLLVDDTGLLDTEVASLNSQQDRIQQEIDRIERQIEDYRDRLLAQFQALEQVVASVNTLLSFLQAQADSVNGAR